MAFKLESVTTGLMRFQPTTKVRTIVQFRNKGEQDLYEMDFETGQEAQEFVDAHRAQYAKNKKGEWTTQIAKPGKWDWFTQGIIWI